MLLPQKPKEFANISVLSTDKDSVTIKMDKNAFLSFEDWYDSHPETYSAFESIDPREVLNFLALHESSDVKTTTKVFA